MWSSKPSKGCIRMSMSLQWRPYQYLRYWRPQSPWLEMRQTLEYNLCSRAPCSNRLRLELCLKSHSGLASLPRFSSLFPHILLSPLSNTSFASKSWLRVCFWQKLNRDEPVSRRTWAPCALLKSCSLHLSAVDILCVTWCQHSEWTRPWLETCSLDTAVGPGSVNDGWRALVGPWSLSEKCELRNQRWYSMRASTGLSKAWGIPTSFVLKGVLGTGLYRLGGPGSREEDSCLRRCWNKRMEVAGKPESEKLGRREQGQSLWQRMSRGHWRWAAVGHKGQAGETRCHLSLTLRVEGELQHNSQGPAKRDPQNKSCRKHG